MSITEHRDEIKKKIESMGQEMLDAMDKFKNEECNAQTNQLSHNICKYLKEKNLPYKFVVNVTLFDKSSEGISLSGTCVWNTSKDEFIRIERQSANLILLVSLWIISIE